jgi:hypothetical protein
MLLPPADRKMRRRCGRLGTAARQSYGRDDIISGELANDGGGMAAGEVAVAVCGGGGWLKRL